VTAAVDSSVKDYNDGVRKLFFIDTSTGSGVHPSSRASFFGRSQVVKLTAHLHFISMSMLRELE
jgi:hypothetical protein